MPTSPRKIYWHALHGNGAKLQPLGDDMTPEFVFGASDRFSTLICELDRAAKSPYPILLLGETGVGKELLARRAHDMSPRKRFAFVPINCGSISAGLFESELYGHERGAFSGAYHSKVGLARLAHQGTLFLDELGEMSPELQVKLLRFLDSGEIRPVGSNRLEKVDVRIVAATNSDLISLVAQGHFRQDLWERLSVFCFKIPPLRDRVEDQETIARSILERLEAAFDPAIFPHLQSFDWPGNVRQLRNVLIRASIFGGEKISPGIIKRLLEDEARNSFETPSIVDLAKLPLADIERTVILNRLKICRGNRKKTAKELGIAKSTLHEKLKRWDSIDATLLGDDDGN